MPQEELTLIKKKNTKQTHNNIKKTVPWLNERLLPSVCLCDVWKQQGGKMTRLMTTKNRRVFDSSHYRTSNQSKRFHAAKKEDTKTLQSRQKRTPVSVESVHAL